MYSKARLHWKKSDPVLYEAALLHEIEDLKLSEDLYRDICWTIVGQQLSGKAADTIFARFEALLPGRLVVPEAVMRLSDEEMRSAGLSGAKSRAIRSLSERVLAGELDLKKLPLLPDADVLAELTKVKGIGPWTAEMLLMFSLGRADVFSWGDLGLRKGIMHLYGWKKMPSERRLKSVLASWAPYRTYAARVLWRVADANKMRIARKRKAK